MMMAERTRGRVFSAIVVLLVITLVVVLVTRPAKSPVGHWDSADGRDRYLAAYDEAFEALPDAESFDIRTDYGVVRVHRFGGAGDTPLVLLPGRSSGTPVWADNLPPLLGVGDVYAVDLLGEPGLSIQDRPIENDADEAEWFHQTLAALPEEDFHVVGLSIGGRTAVNLALHRPEHVSSLTLLEPALVFDDIPLETVIRSLPAAFPWMPRSWRDSFNSYTAGGAPVEDAPVADMIEAGMQHYRLRLPQQARIAEEQLAGLGLPVQAILAGRSVMHNPTEAIETARRHAEVEVYPDASHAINGEYPEEIAADIASFLADHSD